MGSYLKPPAKTRGRPVTETGQLVTVRLRQPLLDALDDWISAQPDPKPSRQEVIRHFLAQSLGAEPSDAGLDERAPPPG